MTNWSHWHDDMDELLGGDFDGSLSGLCIMSLSFARNGTANYLNTNRENNSTSVVGASHQASNGLCSATKAGNKSIDYSLNSNNNDTQTESSFKRFKTSSMTNDASNREDEQNKSANNARLARQLQQLRNCLGSNTSNNTSSLPAVQYSSINMENANNNQAPEQDVNRLSPRSSVESCHRDSTNSTPDDSCRLSESMRSPSPAPSCSSSSTGTSHSNSGCNSPADTFVCCNDNQQPAADVKTETINARSNNQNHAQDNQQISNFSVKDGILNGGTFKESSYTTSVITTTAPMHFKSLHHPFSLKQFPLSPFHQFSNSSLNPDFYDRYLSHDSHQPLQTPLIGIDRTQDLLSLKLPPHGPDDQDSQRLPKEWPFEDHAEHDSDATRRKISSSDKDKERSKSKETAPTPNGNLSGTNQKDGSHPNSDDISKGFPFSYKSNSSPIKSNQSSDEGQTNCNGSCDKNSMCDNRAKQDMFIESMKHFNPKHNQDDEICYDLRSKNSSPNQGPSRPSETDNAASLSQQYHNQESFFASDQSKQRFQYVLAAPISVATKLNEDTMTYLNQGQAYEIKLENTTDVAEARKGFMCSIINIGFYERHMQQAENELWQQWSQQHPNEKIFSVDMKLSYNVFGVESDGLNKYEFLWDSSKAAGVFIRINSISTEFTPKKHGGEKGVPFKLSIETFSYNSKTHNSYFISAACCQIKVFKPKGAERKIRSDRDKIYKRPLSEQEKYHRPCDHTTFRECSLTSLHPLADSSLCYYRHSHGHFASEQMTTSSFSGGSSYQTHQTAGQHSDEDVDHGPEGSQQNRIPENPAGTDRTRSNHSNEESDANSTNGRQTSRDLDCKTSVSDYPVNRLMQHSSYRDGQNNLDLMTHNYGTQHNQSNHSDASYNTAENQPLNSFNQIYQNNQARNVSLTGINNSQHFGMPYYGHPLPTSVPTHIGPASNYGIPTGSTLSTMSHPGHAAAFPLCSRCSSIVLPYAPQSNESESLRSSTSNSPQITINSDCMEVVSWFGANRFGNLTKTFSNFSGSDLLRLSKADLIEICGLIDGIRLFNCLHNQPLAHPVGYTTLNGAGTGLIN